MTWSLKKKTDVDVSVYAEQNRQWLHLLEKLLCWAGRTYVRKCMLYIKCDTREMNYAVSSVCADQHKAQGTFSRVSMKICNEFQVHHFLVEAIQPRQKQLHAPGWPSYKRG
eukprot:XP_025008906.1 uncharacterized protein LOC112532905 [Gallus gallus]